MIRTLAALGGLAALAAAAPAQETEPLAEVMVLGTFHFTGGGSDHVNPEVGDFLSDTRQAQIDAVLDRLEEFAPDKIMVELTPEHADEFNAQYQAYRDGESELGVNERQQLGMRLAARLEHERLYAVDYQNGMDFEAMLGAAEAAGETRLIEAFQRATSEMESLFAGHGDLSVMERLREVNRPEFIEHHDLYMTLAQMGSIEDPEGALQMEEWWGRNLVIFSRIAHHAEPGDRILVIYGSGHKFLLDQYFEQAREFEVVDSVAYLQ